MAYCGATEVQFYAKEKQASVTGFSVMMSVFAELPLLPFCMARQQAYCHHDQHSNEVKCQSLCSFQKGTDTLEMRRKGQAILPQDGLCYSTL